MSLLRVAVIGAGATGLVALRHLTARPDLFQAVAFEQTSGIGGTWVYTERVGKDENGRPIHSSMYKSLRTNLPKETMAFPDFPFPETLPSFMSSADVLKYLEDYAEHFDLYKFIQFSKAVESVRSIEDNSGAHVTWEVGFKNVNDVASELEVQLFDAVIVCNGHYSVPLIPELPGLESFPGTVIHSHDYREPSTFKDKIVVCLGAGPSGIDISLDLEQTASKVYLCHREKRLTSELPDRIVEKDGIREVTSKGVILDNGEEVTADALIFCTGYRYEFPFLKDDCKLDVTDGPRVFPLWKHIVHVNYPTLSVIGIPTLINPFPLFDCQVRFVLSCLNGTMTLPSADKMLADIRADYDLRLAQGLPPRKAHYLNTLQWEYNDELADLAGCARLPKVLEHLFTHVFEQICVNVTGFRDAEYRITGPETFQEVTPSETQRSDS